MDKTLNIAQNLLSKLTIKEKVNFVKFPLLIMWLCMPLALWGYITTNNMILFYTFLSLMIFNIIISLIVYFIIVKTQSKELKLAYESLDKFVEQLKKHLEDLVESVFDMYADRKEHEELKPIKTKKD